LSGRLQQARRYFNDFTLSGSELLVSVVSVG
jgi:hypothetical protein